MANKTSIETLTKTVISILEADTESRNDDRRLTFKVLQRLQGGEGKGPFLTLYLRDLRKLPVFATITRVRAIIQNRLHKYLPTSPDVRRKRLISEENWMEYITGTPVFPGIASGN